jgi:hypothetical protein
VTREVIKYFAKLTQLSLNMFTVKFWLLIKLDNLIKVTRWSVEFRGNKGPS